MKPFIQIPGQQSTIQNFRQILVGNDLPIFGAFAYITDSGVAQIITQLGDCFGPERYCRWIFGFDYGRSQPTAIRKLAEIGQCEIRIHDGDYVVQSKGFTPRTSYHLKTALTLMDTGYPCKQIVGSGNLSASGLLSGIEAGCIIDYSKLDHAYGDELIFVLEEVWKKSTPLENVIDEYETKYSENNLPKVNANDSDSSDVTQLFWIDVGYVTKNRGADKPGNQFDLPRGSHVYLGLGEILNPELNSILGL